MEEPSSMPTFWEGIFMGSPLVVALHALMVVSFAASIAPSIRHPGSVTSFAWAAAPFVLGALAMWLGIVGLLAVLAGFMSEGVSPDRLRVVQRPFYLGTVLSFVAFIVYFIARARHSDTRNA